MSLPFQIPLIHSRSPQVNSPPRVHSHRSAPASPVMEHEPSLSLSRGHARHSPLIVDANYEEEGVEEIIEDIDDVQPDYMDEGNVGDDEFEAVGNSVERIEGYDEDVDPEEPAELDVLSSHSSPPPSPPPASAPPSPPLSYPPLSSSPPPSRPSSSRPSPSRPLSSRPSSSHQSSSRSSSSRPSSSRPSSSRSLAYQPPSSPPLQINEDHNPQILLNSPPSHNSSLVREENSSTSQATLNVTPRATTPRANITPTINPRATTPRTRTVHSIPPLDLQNIDSEPIKKPSPSQQSPHNLTQHAYQNMPQSSKPQDPLNW